MAIKNRQSGLIQDIPPSTDVGIQATAAINQDGTEPLTYPEQFVNALDAASNASTIQKRAGAVDPNSPLYVAPV